MQKKTSFSGLLILVNLLAVSWAQAGDDGQDSIASIEVNAAKYLVARNKNTVILDVRTPVEYEVSHIIGAVNVSVQDESFRDMVVALDPNKTYIVHCTKNPVAGRSSRALATLQRLGFEHLYSLEGGYVAWQNAELPLTEPPN